MSLKLFYSLTLVLVANPTGDASKIIDSRHFLKSETQTELLEEFGEDLLM